MASECGFSKMALRVLRRFLLASSSLELWLIASRNRDMSFMANAPTFFTFFSASSPSSIPAVSITVNACRALRAASVSRLNKYWLTLALFNARSLSSAFSYS